MCVVSAVSDKWGNDWHTTPPYVVRPQIPLSPKPLPSKEYEELKAEIEKLHKEIKEAKQQDIINNEPNCVKGEKTEKLLTVLEKLKDISEEIKFLVIEITDIITEE